MAIKKNKKTINMITEKEYLDAVRIVNDYTEQIRKNNCL